MHLLAPRIPPLLAGIIFIFVSIVHAFNPSNIGNFWILIALIFQFRVAMGGDEGSSAVVAADLPKFFALLNEVPGLADKVRGPIDNFIKSASGSSSKDVS
jgi:hypothetical protein